MNQDQGDRIEAGVASLRKNRTLHTGFILFMIALLSGWSVWCQSDDVRARAELRRELYIGLTAQRLAFTDILMRYKEDPKDQARFDKTLEDLIEFYRKKLNEPTD